MIAVNNAVTSKTKNFVWMKLVATAIKIIARTVLGKIIQVVATVVPMDVATATHALHNVDVVVVILVHAPAVANHNVIAANPVEDVVDVDAVDLDYNDILNRLVTNLLAYYYIELL